MRETTLEVSDIHERSFGESLTMTIGGIACVVFGLKVGWVSMLSGFEQFLAFASSLALIFLPRRVFNVDDRGMDWVLAIMAGVGLALIGLACSAFAYDQLINP